MAKKFEKIMPGVVLVGRSATNPGIVYFRKMVNGKRVIKKSSVQGVLAIDDRGRPTRALKSEVARWAAGMMSEAYIERREGNREMTFADLIEQYPKAAALERIKNGRPSEATVHHVCLDAERFMKLAGLKMSDKCSKLTTDIFDITIATAIKDGKSKATAWTYAVGVQSLAAKWTAPYYKRERFEPPKFELPSKINIRSSRYARPTAEQLAAVKQWYEKIWDDPDKRKWLAATMMLQFAMRNGDIARAKKDLFKSRVVKTADGTCVERKILCYTPHKTAQSSARSVAWPIAQCIWEKIEEAVKSIEDAANSSGNGWWDKCTEDDCGKLIPLSKKVFHKMNMDLRNIFPLSDTSKASYELRKICVDHVYQNMGLEKASAISGDDPKTVMYYYADPSQAIVEDGLDVTELI